MKTLQELRKEKGTLVVAHRGSSAGNIPCNTMAAFDVAIRDGADMIEMDLFRNVDGNIFIFHTGKEPSHIDRHVNIESLSTKEILSLKRCNSDLIETSIGIERFEDVLEHLKDRVYLNLDRAVQLMDSVIPIVERMGMKEQILLKSDPSEKSLKIIEEFAPDYAYMPIFMEKPENWELIKNMNINCVGAELVFSTEDSILASDSYLEEMHKEEMLLWGNSLVYNSKVPLAAGHNDDRSVVGDPDGGWGWLVNKGFDLIQTDWAGHCIRYLEEKGFRK